MNAVARNRRNRGQGIVEVVVGTSMLLTPICLFALDVSVVVIGGTVNRRLAYQAARAASHQDTAEKAKKAALKIVNDSPHSTIVQEVSLDSLNYQDKVVSVTTRMHVKCPAPFPGFSELDLVADSWVTPATKPADL